MAETPPPNFAAYPRPDLTSAYGSADKLEALGKGYVGLNYVFLVNVALFLAYQFSGFHPLEQFIGFVVVVFFVVAGLTFPPNKKIGFGKDWPTAGPFLASFLMGLNSALCCGVIGYVVMQQIAMNELKRYGIKTGFLGPSKRILKAAVESRRQIDATPLV